MCIIYKFCMSVVLAVFANCAGIILNAFVTLLCSKLYAGIISSSLLCGTASKSIVFMHPVTIQDIAVLPFVHNKSLQCVEHNNYFLILDEHNHEYIIRVHNIL